MTSSRSTHPRNVLRPWDVWLARLAVVAIATLQALLINDLTVGPRWLAPALELALLAPLSIATAWTEGRARRATTDHHWNLITRHRRAVRMMAIALTATITVMNAGALWSLLHALLAGHQRSGQTLLLDALNVWAINVIVFALWFWSVDRGGPSHRSSNPRDDKISDFLFPQMTMQRLDDVYVPNFVDYLFLSFTNATAFSPTDTLPLSARAKLLMMVEAAVSLLTVALVAARAVNVLN